MKYAGELSGKRSRGDGGIGRMVGGGYDVSTALGDVQLPSSCLLDALMERTRVHVNEQQLVRYFHLSFSQRTR